METTIASTRHPGPALERDGQKAFATRMGLPSAGAVRLGRAVRWALVLSSIGLLLLGIKP